MAQRSSTASTTAAALHDRDPWHAPPYRVGRERRNRTPGHEVGALTRGRAGSRPRALGAPTPCETWAEVEEDPRLREDD